MLNYCFCYWYYTPILHFDGSIMSTFTLNEDTNFEHVIGVIFNNWTALKVSRTLFVIYQFTYVVLFKIAVDHGMGGSSEVMHFKISDLIQNVHECLRKTGLYIIFYMFFVLHFIFNKNCLFIYKWYFIFTCVLCNFKYNLVGIM